MDKLFCRILGEGSPLIILHGLLGSSDNWMSLAKIWAANRKVFLVDQRNHGQSFHAEQFNYDVMVQDLLLLMNDNKIENADIIGHSMGGKVAMKFAIQSPDMVNHLVVVDIGAKFYPVHHDKILAGLGAIKLNTLTSRNEADEILKQYVADSGIRQFLLKNLKRVPAGFDWKINLESIQRNIENVGEELTNETQFSKPTLFLRGRNSDYIKNDDLALIGAIFTNYTLETIDGSGHWVHAEKPKELMKAIDQFILQNE